MKIEITESEFMMLRTILSYALDKDLNSEINFFTPKELKLMKKIQQMEID